jgi:hypothetical protein
MNPTGNPGMRARAAARDSIAKVRARAERELVEAAAGVAVSLEVRGLRPTGARVAEGLNGLGCKTWRGRPVSVRRATILLKKLRALRRAESKGD